MVIKKLRTILLVWLALLVFLALFSSISQTGRDYFYLESSIMDGIMPVFSVFTSVKNGIMSWWNHYIYLVQTQRENTQLKRQVDLLKQENIKLRENTIANERLKKLLQLKNEVPGPTLVAEVVGRSPSPFLQILYINKGRKDGLVRGMPVLRPEGLVGRLEKTSGHYSQVLLINDSEFAVDCLVQRSRVRGVLTGIPGGGSCQIKYIPRTADIRSGDIIITSGLDQLYPKGTMLGRVLRVEPKVKGIFLNIEVIPECNTWQIEEVLVLQKKPPLPDQE